MELIIADLVQKKTKITQGHVYIGGAEYHNWVVRMRASYSEGPESKFGPQTGYPD